MKRSGFTLMEVLVSLILVTISVVIMFQSFKMYVDSRNIGLFFEKAYVNLSSAYEVGKEIIDNGAPLDIVQTAENMGIDVQSTSSEYGNCDEYQITMNFSELHSVLGRREIRINPSLLGFTVLHCK